MGWTSGGIIDRLGSVFLPKLCKFLFTVCVCFQCLTSTFKWRMLPLADYDNIIILYNLCSMNILF